MDDKPTPRDLVWQLHHEGRPISRISRMTGFDPSFVRREILLRWALDENAPGRGDDGRDKHEDGRPDAGTGE